MAEVNKELKQKYDSQYSDNTEEWRRLGAEGKAQNIVEIAKNYSFQSVIEIGAGDGNVLKMLSEMGFCDNLTAAEISDSAIAQIKKKNIKGLQEVKQFDGYVLPFADKQFDLAFCTHVIEHVEHPRILMDEIKRISKRQIFEVPIDFSFKVDKKFDHYNAYGHINIYTPALFNFLLYTQGFKILQQRHNMYNIELINYLFPKTSKNYIVTRVKRFVWSLVPMLKRIKPNCYTVLTE